MYTISTATAVAAWKRMSALVVGALATLALASAAWAKQPTVAAPAAAPLAIPEALEAALRPGPPETIEQLRLLQQQVRRVVALGRPVTVAIEMNDSVGSGVIISADGLVLTAGHVSVEPNREVSVRFPDGHRVKARSLGVNHDLDSGLVRIIDEAPHAEGEEPAWPFTPIAEQLPEPGDWVVGLGQPNGFVEGRDPPVRLGRVLDVDDETINTDVTLVGGDSGGPLFNLRGEVVGIHSKIGEQITRNYHVPVAAFRREWRRLNDGRMTGVPDGEDPDDWRPFAGLTLRQQDDALVVTQVFPDRAAQEAGLAPGDIIVELGGEKPDGLADVERLVRKNEAFARLPIVVERAGVEIELTLWLGRAPADFPGAQLNDEDRRR